MKWDPDQILKDFQVVAELAGISGIPDRVRVEILRMPHVAPSNLPKGKMAVYVFSEKDRVLKVGRVNQKSQPRYTSQHYKVGLAKSSLASSILKDEDFVERCGVDAETVSDWIKENTDRVNFILDAALGVCALKLLEAFVQCRLQPKYEGYASQQ